MDTKIEPGKFLQMGYAPPPDPIPIELQAPELTSFSEEVIAKYQLFIDKFHPDRDRILYPGCGFDENPARAFGKDAVLHVDINRKAIEAFLAAGYRAKKVDMWNFIATDLFDVILLMNFWHGRSLELLRPGGYIIVNNRFRQADKIFLANRNNYKYLGNIDESDDGPFLRIMKPKNSRHFYTTNPAKILASEEPNNCRPIYRGTPNFHIFKKIR